MVHLGSMIKHNNSQNESNGEFVYDEESKRRNWRNEHGQPDFEFLQSLVNEDNLESLEKLCSIAEDLDIIFEANSSPQELVDRIRSTVSRNGADGFQPTT